MTTRSDGPSEAGAEAAAAEPDASASAAASRLTLRQRFAALSLARKVIAIVLAALMALLLAGGVTTATLIAVGGSRVRSAMQSAGSAPETLTYDGRQYALNHDIVTFLFLGADGRNKQGMDGQVDVFMVAAIDTKTGRSDIITIPRDSVVSAPYYVGDVKLQDSMQLPLTLVYAFAGGGEQGRTVVAQTVSGLLGGIAVPYYYMLDYTGMPDLNDAIGGVTLTPIQSIPDTDIVEGQPITLKGWDAERYVRWRDHETLQSPLDRQKREVHYAKAFLAQAKQVIGRNPLRLVSVMRAVNAWSSTNVGTPELAYYAWTALRSSNLTDLPMQQLPGELRRSGNHARMVLDADGVQRIIVDTFYKPVDAGN